MRKVIILGPAGSGKTTLANKLADSLGIQAIHFDSIKWVAKKQTALFEDILATIDNIKEQQTWVIEGPATFLSYLFEDATDIIFLNIDKTTCIANLRNRGSAVELPWEETEEEFNNFILEYENKCYDICYSNIQKLLQNKDFIELTSVEEISNFSLE